MTGRWALAWAGVRGHLRGWFGVGAGAVLCCAFIVGGLSMGDALRAGLAARTAARLGPVEVVLRSDEAWFRAALAEELGGVAVLSVDAVASGEHGARSVRLLGVPGGMGGLADVSAGAGEARALPGTLDALGVSAGGRVVLRYERPSLLPREAALVQEEGRLVALPLTVGAPLDDRWPARFALDAGPDAPPVVLTDRDALAAAIGQPGRANLALFHGRSAEGVAAALRTGWRLEDAGLELVPGADGAVVLRTPRVLLPVAVSRVAQGWSGAEPVLTWFADRLAGPKGAVPYSFVAARPGVSGAVLPAVIAAELGLGVGDPLWIDAPIIGRGRAVHTERTSVTVTEIVGESSGRIPDRIVDPSLVPVIEGLSGRARCRDWNPGLPVDLDRIRPEDEAWWSAYGAAARVVVPLPTAQAAWKNGYGEVSSVRLASGTTEAEIIGRLHDALEPGEVGLTVLPVGADMAATERPANDFGALFLGFQFVLLASALTLVALVTGQAVTARAPEWATLRALGFTEAGVWRLVLREAAIVAAVGTVVGLPLSLGVREALLWGLAGAWRGAVGEVSMVAASSPVTLVGGSLAAFVVVMGASVLAARALRAVRLRDVLARSAGVGAEALATPSRRARVGAVVGGLSLLTVAALVTPARTPAGAGAFFGAGAATLLLLLSLARIGLDAASVVSVGRAAGLVAAGLGRRAGRSATVIGVLAAGTFLVVGVGLGAGMPEPDPTARDGGAGGFPLYLTAAVPLVRPIDDPAGTALLGLPTEVADGVEAVGFRRRAGDDASCLQLGSARTPHVLGVDPAALDGRFSFGDGAGWERLKGRTPLGHVPVVGDAPTLQWGLHLGVGDVLTLTDGRGEPLQVEIVGILPSSVLQGSIVMSEAAFLEAWPDDTGAAVALVGATAGQEEAVREALSHNLVDHGVAVMTSGERLHRFAEVEQTYIAVFRALGGLGLILGAVGVGVVLAQNAAERAGERALLVAIGFGRARVARLIAAEHVILLVAGLGIGVAAATVAAWPVVAAGAAAPWIELGTITGAALGVGTLAVWLASRPPGSVRAALIR